MMFPLVSWAGLRDGDAVGTATRPSSTDNVPYCQRREQQGTLRRLVSSNFLASDFIAEKELPPLLEAAGKDGLTVVWVPISASAYTKPPIADFQAACDAATPLDSLPAAKRSRALVEICENIEAAYSGSCSELATAADAHGSPVGSSRSPLQPAAPRDRRTGCPRLARGRFTFTATAGRAARSPHWMPTACPWEVHVHRYIQLRRERRPDAHGWPVGGSRSVFGGRRR